MLSFECVFFYLVKPQAKRAIFISFTALTLNCASGTLLILSYVTDIFTKTGSSLSTNNSSLLISIIQIVANLIFLNIVERVNRKSLQISSSILTTLSFFMFASYGLFCSNHCGYEWMPPFSFSCIVFASWLGQIPIPYIITFEIFPKEVREIKTNLNL